MKVDPMHAHRKNVYKGDAAKNIEYVTRQGRHKHRSDLVSSGHMNLPAGVESFGDFVGLGDGRIRSKGIVMKQWSLGFPRVMSHSEADQATVEIARRLSQGKPVHYAVHDSPASDGGTNLHAHISIVPRTPDRVQRHPADIFARANPNVPGAGGWKAEREAASREGFGIKLRGDRQMCATVINAYLERGGHEVRVDARSFSERGLDKQPGKHLFQSGMRRKLEREGLNTDPI